MLCNWIVLDTKSDECPFSWDFIDLNIVLWKTRVRYLVSIWRVTYTHVNRHIRVFLQFDIFCQIMRESSQHLHSMGRNHSMSCWQDSSMIWQWKTNYRKSCGKPQEAYRPQHIVHSLSCWRGRGWGYPILTWLGGGPPWPGWGRGVCPSQGVPHTDLAGVPPGKGIGSEEVLRDGDRGGNPSSQAVNRQTPAKT